MPHTFTVGESAYILNSHRTRAHAAQIVSSRPDGSVLAVNTDTIQGPLEFDANGWPTDPAYQHTGILPARLVPAGDPEALRLRQATEALRASTLHYDEVVECAANLKRDSTAAKFDLLLGAVESWGDDLGMDW